MPPVPQRLSLTAPAAVFPVAWLRYFPGDVARALPPRAAHTWPLELMRSLSDFPDLPPDAPLRFVLHEAGPVSAPNSGELVRWAVSPASPTIGYGVAPPAPPAPPAPTAPASPPHVQQLRGPPTAPPRGHRSNLTLHRYLYSAHVFDVYAAHLGAAPVLVQLTDLRSFAPPELPALLTTCARELRLAARLGASGLAPEFLGAYGAAQPDRSLLVCLVFAGARELTRIERHDAKVQAGIVRLYNTLHEQGVAHGSVGWRHVRMRGDDIVLFDFEHASERGDPGWEEKRVEETARVKALIKWR